MFSQIFYNFLILRKDYPEVLYFWYRVVKETQDFNNFNKLLQIN